MRTVTSVVALVVVTLAGAVFWHQETLRATHGEAMKTTRLETPARGRLREPAPRIPLIGEAAPSFEAVTTQGVIHFPDDYRGKWVVLFSHPSDFTPVCTTELMAFSELQTDFNAIHCELIGLSVDSVYSHIAWLRAIRDEIRYNGMERVDVRFPVIADVKMEVARRYGMVHPASADSQTVRGVFVIDPEAKIRAIVYYPMTTGRNMSEILRLLVAIQTADRHQVATPADWTPGDDVIVPPPRTMNAAERRAAGVDDRLDCHDWFFCLKKLPKGELRLPPAWE